MRGLLHGGEALPNRRRSATKFRVLQISCGDRAALAGLNGGWYNLDLMNGSTCFTGRRTDGGAG